MLFKHGDFSDFRGLEALHKGCGQRCGCYRCEQDSVAKFYIVMKRLTFFLSKYTLY